MSSSSPPASTTPHWGKRLRDDDDPDGALRFSELSPEQKLQRRRQERTEKKERDRTMAYFKSVQRVLEEHAGGSGDASTLANIVDGFFVELVKRLKADPTLHLLRNGTVCRVIEAALANSLLLHSKSLLYVLLGHIADLVVSPVASYLLETLLASMSLALIALAESPEELEAELAEGGPGTHVGSGVPSSATLLQSLAEEVAEQVDSLLLHEVGARALRSILLVLGGYSIRNAPPPPHPVRFPDTLGVLAAAIVESIERCFSQEYDTKSDAETWMAAAQTTTTSLIVQSLLRVCEEGSPADVAVRQRLDRLQLKGQPLLQLLLEDPVGCHLFQAYVKVPTPAVVSEAGARAALRLDTHPRNKKEELLRAMGVDAEDDNADHHTDSEEWTEEKLLRRCGWGTAMCIVDDRMETLLQPGSELVMQTGFVLQDLALYAPSAMHLRLLWQWLLQPRLDTCLNISALASALCAFVRKCAFSGSVAEDGEETTVYTLPSDLNALLKKDESQGVRYFTVPVSFQREVCTQLCACMKQHTAKGAAQYLLVDAPLGDRGVELARYLLHLHPTASSVLQHSIDKMKLNDVVHIATQHKGSQVLQQFLRAASFKPPVASAAPPAARSVESGAAASEEKGPTVRFFRRISDHLADLVGDKYGAYVVEVLYDVSGVDGKEQLVRGLIPVYEGLRDHRPRAAPVAETQSAETDEGDVEGEAAGAPAEDVRRHIARKVLTKCCVEQYIHRPEDWKKLAQRQCQVQRLLSRMLLEA